MKNLRIRDVYIGDDLLKKIIIKQSVGEQRLESELMSGFILKAFLEGEILIGYALFINLSKINLSRFLDDLYDREDIATFAKEIKEVYPDAICLDSFEIFDCFKNRGYGKFFFNELFQDRDVFLYSLFDSIGFWENLGFESFHDEQYYLVKISDSMGEEMPKRAI